MVLLAHHACARSLSFAINCRQEALGANDTLRWERRIALSKTCTGHRGNPPYLTLPALRTAFNKSSMPFASAHRTPPHPSRSPVRANALDLCFQAIDTVILVVVGVRCTCGCDRVDEVCGLSRERVYRRGRRSSNTHLRPRFHIHSVNAVSVIYHGALFVVVR
jgi:hypothetical protein